MKISKTFQIRLAIEKKLKGHGFVYQRKEMTVDELINEMGVDVEACSYPWTMTDLKSSFFFINPYPQIESKTNNNIYHNYHIDEISDLERMKLWIILQTAREERWAKDDAAL